MPNGTSISLAGSDELVDRCLIREISVALTYLPMGRRPNNIDSPMNSLDLFEGLFIKESTPWSSRLGTGASGLNGDAGIASAWSRVTHLDPE